MPMYGSVFFYFIFFICIFFISILGYILGHIMSVVDLQLYSSNQAKVYA